MNEETEKAIVQTTEWITIDYANLSGRESANRSEFRERVRKHLEKLTVQVEGGIDDQISKWLTDLTNTPLNFRGNSFDQITKLRKKIINKSN